tara:strand:- start:2091 stop:4781 length:2691 start_codon:yes stop_codon:yes gene_type:complete
MKRILLILLFPIITFAQKECVISLTTDSYPSETYWILFADSLYGDTIADVQAGHYTQSNTTYQDTCYISDTISTIVFLIRDTYGDGMNGSYYVAVCEDTIINRPTVSFTTGLYTTRTVPQCLPNPPPGPCVPAMVNINLDQFQGETSWDIKDTMGNLLYSGGPYPNAPDYEPQFIPVCLPVGNLVFTIYDSYGDGMAGSLWGGNDGSYYLFQCGDTLVYGTEANFGTDSTHVFISDTCTPPPPVPGCMDEDYLEYDPLATVDDSSCVTLKIWGCIDSTMFNYDPVANYMDYIDSCDYTLILHDLVGNGWVGSKLEIYQEDKDTLEFHMSQPGLNQYFSVNLHAPDEVNVKFFVSQQASNTALECGFTLVNPFGDTVISVVPPFIVPFQMYTGITYCGNTCVEVVEGCMDNMAFNYDSTANTPLPCYYVPGCMSPAYLEYHIDTSNAVYTDINIQDSCQTLAVFGCTDSTSFNYDNSANVDNGGCLPIITGCMQPLAFNYNPNANTPDTCIAVVYGCTSPIAFNYDSLANTDDGSCIGIIYGCTDSTMWNFIPSANVDDGSCVPYIYGCTDPTMWNYNSLANTDNGTCIAYLYGCTDSTMFNYDPLANTDNNSCIPFILGCTNPIALNYCDSCNTDDFSCILPIYGCMDSTAFNYNPLANVDNGTCVPIILGCTDPTALNYCDSCNTDDFSCILPIYGCTDSTMFNYNPLANVDNSSCIPFIYGCTNPIMLNYNPSANTEDFSCIPYIYGCMDSTALNYDSTANTDNGSCVAVVQGCMDQGAYNYDIAANVNDSLSCLYAADCITGPGIPYWLNDECYAWVIEVDEYCCDNEWDEICQLTYNYCDSSWTGPLPKRITNKKLLKITDVLGRSVSDFTNKVLIYIYNDGTIEKRINYDK